MKKILCRTMLFVALVIFTLLLGSCKSWHKHSFGDWFYSIEPTCSKTGEKYRECKCGERETVAVAPLGVHKLENNICTMCGKNLNPYFFNLFKSLISEDYPLVIKELSLSTRDKTAHYSFKDTDLIVNASGDSLTMQLIGTCQITRSSTTKSYDFVGMLDDESMHVRLITEYDGDTTAQYLSLPLSAVEISSDFASLEENLRESALLNHASTLSLLVNSIKEWRNSATPEIIAFCESHFEEIAPFLNDYFTSLFKVSMIDDRVSLELNFSKIKEFNNALYNKKISTLYEEITKEPYGTAEGKITSLMNTTVSELLKLAEEENLDIDKVVQYCFTALYNLRVISSSKIPDSFAEKINEEYANRTLLSIIAEQLEKSENEVLESTKSAFSKIGELTGYQYVYKLTKGTDYDKTTPDEDASLRDVWSSINSRLISFASFATTTFVTSPEGAMYSFKMTFRVGVNTINIRLDKEYSKDVIPSTTLDEIKSVTSLPSREKLISLLQALPDTSTNDNILAIIRENVNEDLQITQFIEEFNLNECVIIYSPQEDRTIKIILLGSVSELDENGKKLDTGADYATYTVIYDTASSTIIPQ